MKNVIVRALSGAVYVGAIIAAIYLGPLAFCILTVIFTAIAMYEYFMMSHAPYGDNNAYIPALALDTLAAVMLCVVSMFDYSAILVIGVLLIYLLLRATISLLDKGEHAFREVAKSVFGVIYIGLPMYIINTLESIPYVAGTPLIFLMFVMIWVNDTGAYCFGVTLGKHRLCERLSPKKSWEGFWGGMLCCVLFGVACYLWINPLDINVWQWVILSVLICLFATWGDLFESMMKRTVHVKDSGHLIPGHGGILDRIDSLLFVAPMTAVYIIIISQF